MKYCLLKRKESYEGKMISHDASKIMVQQKVQ